MWGDRAEFVLIYLCFLVRISLLSVVSCVYSVHHRCVANLVDRGGMYAYDITCSVLVLVLACLLA